MAASCPHCACTSADGARAHALLALLTGDDLDAAFEHGLLMAQPCPQCSDACTATLIAARDGRVDALAARDRHRHRAQRLAQRQATRDASRMPPASTPSTRPALPAAAADALARALAKAGGRKPS